MEKKGFTLVELSIVLVIIGLLIGGILAAQSMISTAKIQALTRQVGQFDAAEANFETKYNQLPGDTNLMGNVLGNNDGIIGSCNGPAAWCGELAKYWSDLSTSGLSSPTGAAYADNSAATTSITVNMASALPVAEAGTNAYFIVVGSSISTQYYLIGQPISGSAFGGINDNSSFKPAEALAIDQKIDDGNPSTGNLIAADGNNTWIALIPSGTNGTTCTTQPHGSVYQVLTTTPDCFLAIRLGVSIGNLK